jgi:Tfp pilus assembly protein PilN
MSPHINLLDWRGRQRQREGRRYLLIVAALLTTVLLCGVLIAGALQFTVQRQTSVQAQLENQLRVMQAQLDQQHRAQRQRELWLQQLRQGYDWQAQRLASVHWLDELVRLHAPALRLQQLQFQDGELLLQGVSTDSEAPLIYAQRLEASPWFTDAQLRSLHRDPADSGVTTFSLSVETRTWPEFAAAARASFDEVMAP